MKSSLFNKNGRGLHLFCMQFLAVIVVVGGIRIYGNSLGFSAGWKEAGESTDYVTMITGISVEPKEGCEYRDSILNMRTGEMLRMSSSVMDLCPSGWKMDRKAETCLSVLDFAFVLLGMVFWVIFVQIIWSVSKGRLFVKQMERRLVFMGIILVAVYLSSLCRDMIAFRYVQELFEFADYDIVMEHSDQWRLFLGLGLLVLSQIFAVGRKMKEEQDLTV